MKITNATRPLIKWLVLKAIRYLANETQLNKNRGWCEKVRGVALDNELLSRYKVYVDGKGGYNADIENEEVEFSIFDSESWKEEDFMVRCRLPETKKHARGENINQLADKLTDDIMQDIRWRQNGFYGVAFWQAKQILKYLSETESNLRKYQNATYPNMKDFVIAHLPNKQNASAVFGQEYGHESVFTKIQYNVRKFDDKWLWCYEYNSTKEQDIETKPNEVPEDLIKVCENEYRGKVRSWRNRQYPAHSYGLGGGSDGLAELVIGGAIGAALF